VAVGRTDRHSGRLDVDDGHLIKKLD